jgi:hypothetical protein
MCRQSISLFDLQQGEERLYPYNPDLSEMTPLVGSTYLLQDLSNLPNVARVMHNRLPTHIIFDERGAMFTNGSTASPTVKYQWHNPSRTIRFLDQNSTSPLTLTFACDWRTIHRASTADQSIVGCIYRPSEETTLPALPRTPPSYHSNTLFGNTFCQARMVGLASYHFVSKDECYISYEHTTTAVWGTLDSGVALPSRVPFRNVTFDAEERIFRGSICWWDDFGTTWHGMKQWEYEMHFDEKFYTILSGQVHSITLHNHRTEMSVFGETLLYCNAALFDVFRDVNYREASVELRESLQRQGASVRVLALLHSLLTVAAQGESSNNPIDYNL